MQWERRTFIKTLLATLAGTGTLTLDLNRYAQALAAPTSRKLALLVGIDDYQTHGRFPGCITDVHLQRELLIHRFGFNPRDILTITGKSATREAIEIGFQEQLVDQAKAGDVVIFHFSGLGTRVKLSDESEQDAADIALGFLPSDGILPTQGEDARNDLLESTLLLMARSLPTDKFTLILDTSHHSPDHLPSSLKIRSFAPLAARPNREELAFQAQYQRRLNIIQKRSPLAGTILRATNNDGIAAEIKQEGIEAGLFSYLLTQSLWQSTSPSKISVIVDKVTEQTVSLTGVQQQPQYDRGAKSSLSPYSTLPENMNGVAGLITAINGQDISIELCGIPILLMSLHDFNAYFEPVSEGQSKPLLRLSERQGLKARAKIVSETEQAIDKLTIGEALQESIRILPRNIGLTVALDSSFERIERVDATSALSSIGSVNTTVAVNEQSADCVLGKVISQNNYGLFSPAGTLLQSTAGQDEAIKSAVGRLSSYFEQLLALKYCQLTVNEEMSHLAVRACLESVEPKPKVLIERGILKQNIAQRQSAVMGIPQFPGDQSLQYRLENNSDRPLYCLITRIDIGGQANIYCPSQSLEPTGVFTFAVADNWKVMGQLGLIQSHFFFNSEPFTAVQHLLQPKTETGEVQSLQTFVSSDPLSFIKALLQDLHNASGISADLLNGMGDVFALNAKTWASFPMIYRLHEATDTINT